MLTEGNFVQLQYGIIYDKTAHFNSWESGPLALTVSNEHSVTHQLVLNDRLYDTKIFGHFNDLQKV